MDLYATTWIKCDKKDIIVIIKLVVINVFLVYISFLSINNNFGTQEEGYIKHFGEYP